MEQRQNTTIQTIGDFDIAFRTMPQDLEDLKGKPGLKKKEMPSESQPIPPPALKTVSLPIPKPPIPVPKPPAKEKAEAEQLKKQQQAEIKAKKTAEAEAKKEAAKKLKAEKEALKTKQKALLQEGKSLLSRKFYQEAIVKFEELIKTKPSWLARFYLVRAKKKILEQQKAAEKAQKEAVEKLKQEEARKKAESKVQEAEKEKLRREEEAKKIAEAKAQQAEKERIRAEEELKLLKEQQKAVEIKRQAETILPEAPKEIKPEPPREIEKPKEEITIEPKPKFNIKQLTASPIAKLIGAGLVILLVAGGLIYLLGIQKIKLTTSPSPTPVATPTPSATTTELVLPAALFPVDATETLILKQDQEKKLFSELQILSDKKQDISSFRRVLIKITNQEEKYLNIADFLKTLDIACPLDILNNLDSNFTLFFYSQKDVPISPFLAGLGRNKLGLVLETIKPEDLNQQLASWELTMEKDLEPLFLDKKMILGFSQAQFQDRFIASSTIRYMDLPDRFVSLNYLLLNNKLLITTSQESMDSLIDKLNENPY